MTIGRSVRSSYPDAKISSQTPATTPASPTHQPDETSRPELAANVPEEAALPVLVAASFEAAEQADTFLDVSDAGHGVAYVNGFCVGRYWNIGPQQTLYVPAPLVREGHNEVLLLDLEKRPMRLALAETHAFEASGA